MMQRTANPTSTLGFTTTYRNTTHELEQLLGYEKLPNGKGLRFPRGKAALLDGALRTLAAAKYV